MSNGTSHFGNGASPPEPVPVHEPRERPDLRKAGAALTVIEGTEESNAALPHGDRILVAVIPAFNEERFIASVVLRTLEHANHVIVVDDGSSDATARLAERTSAHVIRQPKNRGKAHALRSGFRAALGLGADVIVCLDADAQHDPAEIPRVAAPVLEGRADVVIGTRFDAVRSRIPAWRQVGQHALTVVTNTLSGVRVSDSQSGFRAFSPSAARTLKVQTGGLSVESEMQFLFKAADLRVVEVPISVQYKDGNKRNPLLHGLQVLDVMLSLVARRRPLMFFTLPGAVVALVGGLVGASLVARVQQSGEFLVGVALLSVLLLLVGALLGVTGIMLHSIGFLFGRLKTEVFEELWQEHA